MFSLMKNKSFKTDIIEFRQFKIIVYFLTYIGILHFCKIIPTLDWTNSMHIELYKLYIQKNNSYTCDKYK